MAGVHYFLQEDRSKEVNFYELRNLTGDIVTLRDIKQSFPVKGNFHFRFRIVAFESNPPLTVWMEVRDLDQPVPTFKGNIVVKALAIPPFTHTQAMARQRKVYKTMAPQPQQRSVPELSQPVPEARGAVSHPRDDFIDLRTPPKQPSAANFAQFPTAPISSSTQLPKANPEGFSADPSKGLTTQQLKAQKESYVEKSVANKLTESRVVAERQKALVEGKLKVGRELEERYKAWEERHSQKNNLRTLLTTLHTVLWAGAEWRQVSPGDLVLPKAVKLQYFRALQVVHPDHHQNDPADIQFISERCYAALSEAWRRFQTEPK